MNQLWVHMSPHPEPPSFSILSFWVVPEHQLWMPCFMHWICTGHLFYIFYMFQCYSLKSSHPCLLPHSPKVCSIHSLIKKKVTVWPYDTDHNDQYMILFNRKTVYTWVEPVKNTYVYKYLSKNTFPLLSIVQFHLGTVQEVFPRFRRNLKGSTKI